MSMHAVQLSLPVVERWLCEMQGTMRRRRSPDHKLHFLVEFYHPTIDEDCDGFKIKCRLQASFPGRILSFMRVKMDTR